MDILRYGDLPSKDINDPSISLYQCKNEYGAAALNLVNCSDSQIWFKLDISPLNLDGKTIDSKCIFELRRALYVRVLNAGLVADPLVLQNSKPFPVAPGETAQVWLEANSKGLQPGDYTAALAISAEGQNVSKTLQTVLIKLEVAGKTFPDKLPFFTCNWPHVTSSDRFTSKSTALVEYAIRDLKEHYTNVFVLRIDKILGPNRQGLSLQKLRDELGLRRQMCSFVLFDMRGKGRLEKMFGDFRTKTWDSNFRSYLKQFRDYMLSHGYDYDEFALYPYDEYIGDDFVYVAQIIRSFDPKLKIYANKWFKSENQFKQVDDLIDIWCPHFSDALTNKAKFEKYKSSGVFDQVWCYYCNIPAPRFFAPAETLESKHWRGKNGIFWRTMPILAASFEMTGIGFWVYQDLNTSGWTKDTIGVHGVIYDGSKNPDKNCFPEAIVPSKRWQQWRQGVEDAVCLMGHRDLLDEFFRKPSSELSSEYLTSLRKRADEK